METRECSLPPGSFAEAWTRWTAPFAYWGGVPTGPHNRSMQFPSHAAANGLLRKIVGKRGVHHQILDIALQSYTEPVNITSNEMKTFPEGPFFTDDHRTLRTTTVLRNVTYIIHSVMRMFAKCADPDDNPTKFSEMFFRRARRGDHWGHRPVMGRSEYVAEYELIEDPSTLGPPVDLNEDYGIVPYAEDWEDPEHPLYFTPLRAEHGKVIFPSWEAVREGGICRRNPALAMKTRGRARKG